MARRKAIKKKPIERYEHKGKKRSNNPPVGLVTPDTDKDGQAKGYQYDPHLDPSLQWAGKAEHTSFEVPTVSLHVHERIDPRTIIETVRKKNGIQYQPGLFDSLEENPPLREAIDFYKHDHNWSNRMVAGDSLLVMNSLLEKEGMAGKVQMVYIDPPYGIKYGSNFQPFVNKRDVKDGKAEDLTSEPEMIKAFRDTWELGIHSYLTYLRDRLLLAKEMLTESGSCFVQISDENVHLVRNLMDDVFGMDGFVSLISFSTTSGFHGATLSRSGDYICWYARDKSKMKYRQLYHDKTLGSSGSSGYDFVELDNGTVQNITKEEIEGKISLPLNSKVFAKADLQSQGPASAEQPFEYENNIYKPESIAKLSGNVAQSPSAVFNLLYFQCFAHKLPSRGRLGYSFAIGSPNKNSHWKANYPEGMERLRLESIAKLSGNVAQSPSAVFNLLYFQCFAHKLPSRGRLGYSFAIGSLAKRIILTGKTLRYKRYFDDFSVNPITNIWPEQMSEQNKNYVVQTSEKIVERCMLMTTDPGDLVFDPTCGSGTTANVAEQWGRRWITCDTSRVAVTLAKQRLMTGLFDYYKLAREAEGVDSGFEYKTVPHITLKSIANNEPAAEETLYDQPLKDNKKARVTGPFTVEAVPAQTVKSVDDIESDKPVSDNSVVRSGQTLRQAQWRDELLKTGIRGKARQQIEFSRVELLPAMKYLHAEAETKEDTPQRVVVSFGPQHSPLEQRQVELALQEAQKLKPNPKIVVFAAFQFDPEAAKDIDETDWPGVTLLKAQMNADLLTDDLKKKRTSNEGFWLIGQPDVKVEKIKDGDDKGKYRADVLGFDYYNTISGKIESGGTKNISMWLLDTDYDGRSLLPRQVFFPMAGAKDGWSRLAKNLKAEIDPELIEAYRGTASLPFEAGENKRIAVKIIDDRGIESLKILGVE